jgi:hypothetical protein
VSKGIVVFAGILASPLAPSPVAADAPVSRYRNDPRLARLKQFFAARGYPLKDHVVEFLIAADQNALDWRLLPSISIVESSGGKAARNNNVMGWGSATAKFGSVRESIHAVASRLSSSKLYRNKDLDGVLRTYNTNAEYPVRVKQIMNAIGPARPRLVLAMD